MFLQYYALSIVVIKDNKTHTVLKKKIPIHEYSTQQKSNSHMKSKG